MNLLLAVWKQKKENLLAENGKGELMLLLVDWCVNKSKLICTH